MIKQTQTKMFDFSDVGLDFCAGSKNKFPEVFKKMLATGFNPQTVNSVSISGSTITLTYGVNHGYVADRVLQVTATGGFNKEVYIDGITSNTVTCTVLDADTSGLTGTLSTKVASLGWELVYELSNIQIFKMKHIDDTERYVRFCFQNNASQHNAIAPCIGKTVDLQSGTITDANATPVNANVTTPFNNSNLRWEFSTYPHNLHNNWTYSQGVSEYGKGVCIGSPYHLIFMHNNYVGSLRSKTVAILPTSIPYALDTLEYPVIFGDTYTVSSWGTEGSYAYTARIGSHQVSFSNGINNNSGWLFDYYQKATDSFLPASIDSFNTTTTTPIFIYDNASRQLLGWCVGGLHVARYADSNYPPITSSATPSKTVDVDFQHDCYIHPLKYSNSVVDTIFLAAVVEEVKYGA